MTDQPKEHGAGGGDKWSDEEREAWANVADSEHALSLFVEENEKLKAQVAQLTTERDRLNRGLDTILERERENVALARDVKAAVDHLRARCAQLESAVREALVECEDRAPFVAAKILRKALVGVSKPQVMAEYSGSDPT